jgi:methionyl-tRNA formyltransferase
VLTPSPVATFASENELQVFKPEKIADIAEMFDDIDAVIVIAYGAMIPENLLDIPKHGFINLHFSLLPTWRGAAPVQHAILNGDELTGVTAFRINKGLDTGPILGTVSTMITQHENSAELLERLTDMGSMLMLQLLDGLQSGQVTAHEQSPHDVSYAHKITTDDARINWTHPGLAVVRRIRAMSPAPGAWTMQGEERIKIGRAQLTEITGIAPGEVRFNDGVVLIGTASQAIEVLEVQRPGKTMAPAKQWADALRGDVVLA